jgi:hypothetical protein
MSLKRTYRFWTMRIAEMAKVASAALLVGLVLWLWGCRKATNVVAQSETVVWSEPILLSDPKIDAWHPSVATDIAGNVHVMWSQTMSGDPANFGGDTLFYTRWDGEEWSPSVDILVSPRGAGAIFQDLAVTPDGALHVVWATFGGVSELMYAHAPACCADHPQNWSQPVSLGLSVLQTTALVADDRGRLHAAFASQDTGNIVYRRSDDGGATWPVWVDIVSVSYQDDEYAAYPRLAVDGRGRVHLVWTVEPWPGRLVMYARSDDGGDSWGEPQVIDSVYHGHYAGPDWGPTLIDVETFGEDEVHLIWDGAPTVERNHLWSFDGGQTWSGPDLLFPEISGVGRSGWNDMVVDSAGILHAVALGVPLYDTWPGGDLLHSAPIAQGRATEGAEWMRIALSLGNQLHVVWQDKGSGRPFPVWYVHGEILEAPAVAPRPLPTVMPTVTVAATPTAPHTSITDTTLTTGRVRPEPELDNSRVFEHRTLRNPVEPLLIGLIPAALIVGIVFGVTIWRARH